MKSRRLFIPWWILNSIGLFLAAMVLPDFVALGNARLSSLLASIISGFLLTLCATLIYPALAAVQVGLKKQWQHILVGVLANGLGLWLIARYADLTGFGVSSLWVAVVLGCVLFGLQQLLPVGKSRKN